MQKTTTPAGILDPELYTEYSEQWLNKISETDNPNVSSYFEAEGGGRMAYLEFSIQRVIQLVSAVGVRRIKARFVLLPQSMEEQYRFSLVLYAADDEDRQLTAFYLPDSAAGAALDPHIVDIEVPTGLAGLWQGAWVGASPLTTAMFTTSYGPLEGYNFEIEDFLSPLFTGTEPYTNQQVRLWLGLHEYVAATDSTPTQTFGLVVRRFDPDTTTQVQVQVQGKQDAEFFDMSTPCPPTH